MGSLKGGMYLKDRAEELAKRFGIRLEKRNRLVVATLPSNMKVYFTSYSQFVVLVEHVLENLRETKGA